MEQRTSELEGIILHNAMQESHRHYGGQAPALNPLEMMIKAETGGDEEKTAEAAEILLKLLTFATDGINLGGIECRWKRIKKVIKPWNTVHYEKEDAEKGVYFPFVELRGPDGKAIQRWEPARLKAINKPQLRTRFNSNGIQCRTGTRHITADIKALEITPQSAAIRVGTRIISMATLAGVTPLRELSGAGIAKRLGVTRQAVSLTNRATDEKIREATGGKSGAYGLRHTVDPRKGKAKAG